jgi:hypothetical protein
MIPALGLSNNTLTLLFPGARAVSFFTSLQVALTFNEYINCKEIRSERTKFPYFKHVTKIKKENLKPKFAYQIDLTAMKEEKQKPGSFSVF